MRRVRNSQFILHPKSVYELTTLKFKLKVSAWCSLVEPISCSHVVWKGIEENCIFALSHCFWKSEFCVLFVIQGRQGWKAHCSLCKTPIMSWPSTFFWCFTKRHWGKREGLTCFNSAALSNSRPRAGIVPETEKESQDTWCTRMYNLDLYYALLLILMLVYHIRYSKGLFCSHQSQIIQTIPIK